MQSKFFPGIFALVVLLSCKKEKDNVTDTGTKLTKLTTVSGNFTTTNFFTYDAQGKLSRWREVEAGASPSWEDGFRIQRAGSGMIEKVVFKYSHANDSSTLVVTSSGQRYIDAKYTMMFGSTSVTTTYTFTYDNAGNITSVTEVDTFSYPGSSPDPKNRLEYTYANGNITSLKVYRISGGTNDLFMQYDFTYDQKPNPLAFGAEWVLLSVTNLVFAPMGSANNWTNVTAKQSGMPQQSFPITLTYNKKNLPEKAVQKDAGGQVVATIDFTYQ